LLLPPGVEPHGFEPKPEDIIRINTADIFIYTGKYMEPWAEKILKGIDNKALVIVDSSKGITLIKGVEDHGHAHGHGHDHAHEMDPHIWLDFENAQKMVDNMLKGFIAADPANEPIYRKNAGNYKSLLIELDNKFREGLALCKTRYFIHGGHYAFGYMAKRYGLHYISAYHGFSPDAEPSARKLVEIIRKMKKHDTNYVFYEGLISPRVAEVIAKETGANLLLLHGAHNLTRDDWEKGVTFIQLMEHNLANLRAGLQCQ
jgi:zinc transport system substrate-binding protein